MKTEYDDLYGMSLSEYCEKHNTNIEALIEKVSIDLEILKKNFEKEYTGMIPTPLGDRIYASMEKKRKHLMRLQEWKSNENFCS